MNITKLRNKLFSTCTSAKFSLFIILLPSFIFAVELSIEDAATKWIENSKEQFIISYGVIEIESLRKIHKKLNE